MTIGEMVGIEPDVRSYAPSQRLVDSSTLIGVEIEVENVTKAPNIPMWKVKADGSLRNNGVEYVFSTPMMGQDILTAIDKLYKGITAAGNKPDFTERCGLHVHVDVRSLSYPQYISFLYHVLLVERTLYKYCGRGRDDNVFCIPYYKADAGCSTWTLDASMRDVLYTSSKYYGTNVNATKNYGSVEFRMHPGVPDPQLVVAWVNILLALRKHAVKNAEATQNFIYTVSAAGAVDYVIGMFDGAAEILPFIERDDVYAGLRQVQALQEQGNIASASRTLPKKLGKYSLLTRYMSKKGVDMLADAEAKHKNPFDNSELERLLPMNDALDADMAAQVRELHRVRVNRRPGMANPPEVDTVRQVDAEDEE